MPTYTVHSAASAFTREQRGALARAITELHSTHTGAPRSFVQTIFLTVAPDGHFVGAEPADPDGVWIYGHIRAGRAPDVRTALASDIARAVTRIAGVASSQVWVYLNQLEHTDMIEFGEVLPPPGGETDWVQALDPDLRDRLAALG